MHLLTRQPRLPPDERGFFVRLDSSYNNPKLSETILLPMSSQNNGATENLEW